MANYIQTRMLGAAAPMVDKNKGDFSNRVNCAGAQLKNNASTLVQDAVVIGGTAAGVGLAAKKGGKFARVMSKLGCKITKGCQVLTEPFKNNKAIHKGIQKFKQLPLRNKAAVATVIGLGTAALSFVTGKQIYKAGQIDQKYTDKAQIEKHQNEVLD